MKHDLLADVLSTIDTSEKKGKRDCIVPASKFIKNVLDVIKKSGYIGEISEEKNGFKIELLGKINKIKVIKPRFSVGKTEYDEWERRYLPSRSTGVLIISTSKGVMDQKEAKEKKHGGKIVAYLF